MMIDVLSSFIFRDSREDITLDTEFADTQNSERGES